MAKARPYIQKDPPAQSLGIFYWRLAALLVFTLVSFTGGAQAQLQVTAPKTSFGSVQRGEMVKQHYEIINTGDQPLLIKEAEVACSCTSVHFPQKPVLPGQSATVTVNFNTATVYGRQDRVVLLHSNDPKSPAKIRFKGSVSQK